MEGLGHTAHVGNVETAEETMFPHRKPSPVIFQEALERARSSGWTGESRLGQRPLPTGWSVPAGHHDVF